MAKNKIDVFKKELSCYKYYVNKLKELDSQIEVNFYEKTGVKGVRYDKAPSHPSEEAIANFRLTLIEKGDKLVADRERILNQIKYIDGVLNQLPNDIKKACVSIYVQGKTYCQAVNSGDIYWSDAGLFKAIERELEKIL